MQFSKIIFAILPALALATDETSTTTRTSTTILTKTITLSRVHTITAGHNATGTGYIPSSTAFKPTTVPTHTKGPENAGAALDAGKVALAGFAGMMVVAMM